MSDAPLVSFTCWNCHTHQEMDLDDIQQDRLAADYLEIEPDPENPKRYHVKCRECAKFNTIYV